MNGSSSLLVILSHFLQIFKTHLCDVIAIHNHSPYLACDLAFFLPFANLQWKCYSRTDTHYLKSHFSIQKQHFMIFKKYSCNFFSGFKTDKFISTSIPLSQNSRMKQAGGILFGDIFSLCHFVWRHFVCVEFFSTDILSRWQISRVESFPFCQVTFCQC